LNWGSYEHLISAHETVGTMDGAMLKFEECHRIMTGDVFTIDLRKAISLITYHVCI